MTAKEIKEAAKATAKAYDFDGYLYSNHDMQAFNDAICREQRELCAISIDQESVFCGAGTVIVRVLNAQKPEI